ncbi:MAG: DUF1826 domain-containing protein [Pseudomonas sp.]|uniref:DUF1826 domain-containing protein n=1 Tax=Pseudomonas sp. TaxID=306 RepID=UPI0033993D3B
MGTATDPLLRSGPRQVQGTEPEVLSEVLHDRVNLAVWQRPLPAPLQAFARAALHSGRPLAESRVLEVEQGRVWDLDRLLVAQRTLPGHGAFLADLAWLLSAFAWLLDARRIGLRVRSLQQAMCPRFHVDQVPLRLITTYAGLGSQWLPEGSIDRQRLGDPLAEPSAPELIENSRTGDVLLAKGEKWLGNEGAGLIHRSPPQCVGQARLLVTLDWLD